MVRFLLERSVLEYIQNEPFRPVSFDRYLRPRSTDLVQLASPVLRHPFYVRFADKIISFRTVLKGETTVLTVTVLNHYVRF